MNYGIQFLKIVNHFVVHLKLMQHCALTIPQFKKKLKNKKLGLNNFSTIYCITENHRILEFLIHSTSTENKLYE